MIDEWGNEVKQNLFQLLLEKVITRKKTVIAMAICAIVLLISAQVILLLFNSKEEIVKKNNPIPTPIPITKTQTKVESSLATESGFLDLEARVASLKSKIETEDLFESPFSFPPVNIKIDFDENML